MYVTEKIYIISATLLSTHEGKTNLKFFLLQYLVIEVFIRDMKH